MVTGVGAREGSGRAQGSLVVGPSGAALCPSALHVTGSLPGGYAGEAILTSSLVLSPTSGIRDQSTGWPSCEASIQELALADAREGTEAPGLGEIDSQEWQLVDELVRMNEAEWRLLQKLLELAPEQLHRLQTIAGEGNGAWISKDGRVKRLGEPETSGNGTTVPSGILDDIFKKVKEINQRQKEHLNTTIGVANKVSNRLPVQRPEIVALANEFDTEVLDQMVSLIQDTKSLLSGLVAVTTELRQGFAAWEGSGCLGGSPCADFKDDLRTLFADVREAGEFGQSLACLFKPGIGTLPLETGLVESLLIDKAPNALLFALSKLLEEIEPSGSSSGGWQAIVRNLLAEVPDETRADLLELCESEPSAQASAPLTNSSGPVCAVLRPQIMETIFQSVMAYKEGVLYRVKQMGSVVDDESEITIGVTVMGGGTAGGGIKAPAKVVLEVLENLLEHLSLSEDALALRSECLAKDAEIEADLRSCSPPVSILVDRGEWADVRTLLRLRQEEVNECKLNNPIQCRELRPVRAECLRFTPLALDPSPTGYKILCDAYNALIGEPCQHSVSPELCCNIEPPPLPGD